MWNCHQVMALTSVVNGGGQGTVVLLLGSSYIYINKGLTVVVVEGMSKAGQ